MSTPENSIKTNIQLFRNGNEFSERFFKVIDLVNDIQQKFFWLFSDEFSNSKYFGYFIWDNNLSDLSPFFSRDYFANNFTAIVESLKVVGTYESYITILKSALGEDTLVFFESPNPSHLIINITEPTNLHLWSAYTNYEFKTVIPDQDQYPGAEMVLSKSIGDLTINETLKLIEILNINGVFIEVYFGGRKYPFLKESTSQKTAKTTKNFFWS